LAKNSHAADFTIKNKSYTPPPPTGLLVLVNTVARCIVALQRRVQSTLARARADIAMRRYICASNWWQINGQTAGQQHRLLPSTGGRGLITERWRLLANISRLDILVIVKKS